MTEARALLDAWRTNNAINLFLIDKISRAGLRCSLSEHGGRDAEHHLGYVGQEVDR
jgi:hypothetical protein